MIITDNTPHPYCPDEDGQCQYGRDEDCPGIGRELQREENEMNTVERIERTYILKISLTEEDAEQGPSIAEIRKAIYRGVALIDCEDAVEIERAFST